MFLGCYFNRKKSKSVALERLKVLLISDRVDCNPELMDMLKNDISKVISKYLEIEPDSVNIQIRKTSNKDNYQAKLYADAFIKSVTNSSTIKA